MFFTGWKASDWIAITFGLSGLIVSLYNILRTNQNARKVEKQLLHDKRVDVIQLATEAEFTTSSQQTTTDNLIEEIDGLLADDYTSDEIPQILKLSSDRLKTYVELLENKKKAIQALRSEMSKELPATRDWPAILSHLEKQRVQLAPLANPRLLDSDDVLNGTRKIIRRAHENQQLQSLMQQLRSELAQELRNQGSR